MSETSTEATAERASSGLTKGITWEKNSQSSGFESIAYYPNIRESADANVVTVKSGPGLPTKHDRDHTKRQTSDLAARDATRRAVSRAVDQAIRMVEAADSGDAMALSNAGFDLVSVLEDLWALRADREPNWRDLLNLLQGALAKEHFELYTRDKCLGVLEIVSNHLKMWVVEDDDIRSSISILRRAGLDPWKCIAVVPEEK